MTQEQKNLLLKDLCLRLPYGVKVQHLSYQIPLQLLSINPNGVTKDNYIIDNVIVVAQLVSVALILLCTPIFLIFTGDNLMTRCDFLSEGEIIILPMSFIINK